MKKLFVLLILLLSFGRSQAADIEARTGILGAYINFPQSRLFSIQTGLLLHTAGNSFSYGDDWNIDFFVPVYASFHIPLSDKVNLRLNAGVYTGTGEYWNLGATAEAGIEVKRFYVGVNYFQNCVNDRDLRLGLSVGYKFTLF